MRRLLFATLLIAAACQPSNGNGNGAPESAGGESNAASNGPPTRPDVSSSDPNTPVSSSDPQPAPSGNARNDCPIIRSSDWRAHVDAMPGPNNHPRLIVSGRITVPTGGYRLALRMGPVAESYPVQVTIYLDAVPPKGAATQALETRYVRGTWQSEERVGSVTVHCGSEVIARLSNIETAL